MLQKYSALLDVLSELVLLAKTFRASKRATTVKISAWQGELGYELLYWIPFLSWLLRGQKFKRIFVQSNPALKALYMSELSIFCEELIFDSDYIYVGPRKELKAVKEPVFEGDELFINASIMYVLLRIAIARLLPLKIISYFFDFKKKCFLENQRKTSGVTLWLYLNECLSGPTQAMNEKIISSISVTNDQQKISIVLGENGQDHRDLGLDLLAKRLENANLNYIKYDKQNMHHSFQNVVGTLANTSKFICSSGGGSYFAYYFSIDLITISQKRAANYRVHRYFEEKFETSREIHREEIILKSDR